MTSPRWGLTLLAAGQGGAHTIVNESAITLMEALNNLTFETFEDNTPPGSPSDGDTHFTGSSPTGGWSGQASKIAIYLTGWRFFSPKAGSIAYDKENNEWLGYSDDGNEWHPLQMRWSTTEYWTGQYQTNIGGSTKKKVYGKLVQFGTLPDVQTFKTAAHGITTIDFTYPTWNVPVMGSTGNAPGLAIGVMGIGLAVPFAGRVDIDASNVTIYTLNDMSFATADVMLFYSKTGA